MADEPIKPIEQKVEPKKDTVRITLPPKIGTAAGAPARPASFPPQPTVKLPTPPSVTAAKAQEQTTILKKESDTKTIPGGKKRETQSVKSDTSKVKTSPQSGVAAKPPPPPPAAAPRPTTVRLPSPAEVQQATARQPAAPPAPLAPATAGAPAWVALVAIVVALATVAVAALLFVQNQSLGS